MKSPLHYSCRVFPWLLGLCLLYALPLSAQTWQWGKRGGGMFDSGSDTPKEAVVDMATDKAGNVYILAIEIHTGFPDIDGIPLTSYGDRDIVVSKFNCNGTYQWSRTIGGGSLDYPNAIGTDTLGYVYVCGKTYDGLAPYEVHFDKDTAQQPGNEKSLFLIKYDTSGNFKWLRQPNPDTATHLNTYTCQSYDMQVMPDGNVYWLTKLHDGLVSGGKGWAVTGRHPYILQYNTAGDLVSHVDLQMETDIAAFYSMGLQRTRSGNFIIAGGHAYYPGISHFTMGGNDMTRSLFVGMFNSSGKFLWKKENDSNVINSKVSCRPVVDDSGYIYLGGTLTNSDSFNTFKYHNAIRPGIAYSSDPFLCKMDTTGKMIWIRAASGNAANYTVSVVFKNDRELWVSGDYTSVYWDASHYVQTVANEGTHFYVSRFNTSGSVLSIDSLKGPFGPDNFFYCSAADDKGGLYIGGEFYSTLTVAGHTLSSHGGKSDFFFAKLGYPCDCVTPVAAYTNSIVDNTVTLHYTGSTAGIDSVVWTYGNGDRLVVPGSTATLPFTYTYPANGTYTLCVTVYTNCGSDSSCNTVTVSGLGVGNVAGLDQVSVYPNPASDYIRITGAVPGTTGRILDIAGHDRTGIWDVAARQQVPVKELPAGAYLLVLVQPDGTKGTFRLLKH